MTQKYLGLMVDFEETTADVRMAQYESGTRTPKERLVIDVAHALDVSPQALDVPDIDSYVGPIHTLFAIEDLYGLKINSIDGELCLTLDKAKGVIYLSMIDMFSAWQKEAEKLKNGEISEEDYDTWRYNYPRIEAERTRERLDVLRKEKQGEAHEQTNRFSE